MGRPRAAKGPTHISGDGFYGRDDLTSLHCNTLQAASIAEGVEKIIPDFNGGLASIITVELSQDNSKVLKTTIHSRGSLYTEQPKVFKSEKFFKFAGYQFTLANLEADHFSFQSGLSSSLVDGSAFHFSFKKANGRETASREELEALGFNGFSLKLILRPESELWMKFTILLFPLNRGALLNRFPCSNDEKFPALKLDGGHCRMCPSQEDVLPEIRWGLPILPILIAELPFDQTYPASRDLRVGVAALLRRARKPEVKRDLETLEIRWAEIETQGSIALGAERLPERIWPAPSSGWGLAQGRIMFLSVFVFAQVSFPSFLT